MTRMRSLLSTIEHEGGDTNDITVKDVVTSKDNTENQNSCSCTDFHGDRTQ